ncbi:hypothetical protein QN277_007999 [Acacia crassicarpa]|uniref:Uncharacterized protein n=1 Tax=Acacia crassicarpa TaxID=499986 RepID=A0AAE1IRD7_9FABA|nr:hypothetical protein QN277_007999 [Acacia crassicarpa]
MEENRAGGNSTRLQKRAPTSLELDKISNGFPFGFGASNESSNAIPLLSPLIISPQPSLMVTPDNGNDNQRCSSVQGGLPSSSGWQHPAMAPFPEPSSLFSFFQKQCAIVNQAQ